VKYYLSYSLRRIEAEAVQDQRILFAFGGTQSSSKTFNEKANLENISTVPGGEGFTDEIQLLL
jgi:hypothetical protein